MRARTPGGVPPCRPGPHLESEDLPAWAAADHDVNLAGPDGSDESRPDAAAPTRGTSVSYNSSRATSMAPADALLLNGAVRQPAHGRLLDDGHHHVVDVLQHAGEDGTGASGF